MWKNNSDHYETYYADKLWNLLPATYRTEDTDIFDKPGPLREMVNRIGMQAAILRRSIDRLWEDQSIETCDDWVIAYIGDLLATRLVKSLDARGQRLNVAKTIYYRRRAGTVAILEEVAFDITGWDAKVIEFFRRLSRTRHNLDPAIGNPAETSNPASSRLLQTAQGLVGNFTNTDVGGWADLRNNYGASKAHSAFDEFFSTADFRQGKGQVGWYNIPHLGIFLWRLKSFGLAYTTPVTMQNQTCPGNCTFDPTGRTVDPSKGQIGLFAAASRAFGDQWVTPSEWQLPTPISQTLLEKDLQAEQQQVYAMVDPNNSSIIMPNSLGVYRKSGDSYELVPAAKPTPQNPSPTPQVNIYPDLGRFEILNPQPNEKYYITYHYGFSSLIGAGPFDRRILGEPATLMPGLIAKVTGGENELVAPLAALAPSGTIQIDDSLTYSAVSDVGNPSAGIQDVTILAQNKSRPLIRLPAPSPSLTAWDFTGANDKSVLVLEGLFVSGGDIVLRGTFKSVTLNCCTLDPGSAGDFETPPTVYAKSIDGRDLIPCHLWVEGEIEELNLQRCIVGPIRTRGSGVIKTLNLTDTIVQAIRTSDFGLFDIEDLKNPTSLAVKLHKGTDLLSQYLQGQLTTSTQQLLVAYKGIEPPSTTLQRALIADLNGLLQEQSLYEPQRFSQVKLPTATRDLLGQSLQGADQLRLNRLLLQAAYPSELADADSAIALADGEVNLNRCTLLGSAYVHQLEASECILDDVVLVEDYQHGCVRFSAWATGSVLPKPYECVEIAPQSPLFTSREFGQPGFAQLSESVDTGILAGRRGATISAGAQDGSEMGAFAREKNSIKEQSLLIKYEEFMPLGLSPVVIYVT